MLLTILYITNALALLFLCLTLDTDDVVDGILHIVGYFLAAANGLWAASALHLIGGVWPKTFVLLIPNLVTSVFFAWAWSRRGSNVWCKLGFVILTFFNILGMFQ